MFNDSEIVYLVYFFAISIFEVLKKKYAGRKSRLQTNFARTRIANPRKPCVF